METDQTTEGNQPFVAHVPVPSQKEVSSGGRVSLYSITKIAVSRNKGRFMVVHWSHKNSCKIA